mmetsp:Transcript_102909/g.266011  ORF Transcript_102909/g.266011 Transcript_102909/m.266011 type:complete len:346 (-) Transcript_102909:197-1234(-)|eukprot:CAMPEP_0195064902 /NCGR_PEP_ID=MMETSP0448-20130528/10733_1 /TAXON_ID=66468 /ORGANISM="Heterocapsa triquestra, Strain CCMP 448" /LENGTH=345 /DNA_ID=CAMNT_0040095947 /DNA_START=60 /DNA_END=1097 /DNA_ORIENTATION=-
MYSFVQPRLRPTGNTFLNLRVACLLDDDGTEEMPTAMLIKEAADSTGEIMEAADSTGDSMEDRQSNNSVEEERMTHCTSNVSNFNSSTSTSASDHWDEGTSSPSESERLPITTVIIRNMPNDCTQTRLVTALKNAGFDGRFNYLYMPSKFGSQYCKGYGFVNFVTQEDAMALMTGWHGRHVLPVPADWPTLNCSPASIQGLEANLARWNTAKMRRIRNAHHRPLVVTSGVTEGMPAVAATPHLLAAHEEGVGAHKVCCRSRAVKAGDARRGARRGGSVVQDLLPNQGRAGSWTPGLGLTAAALEPTPSGLTRVRGSWSTACPKTCAGPDLMTQPPSQHFVENPTC